MHVDLVRDEVAADSRRVERGDTPDCIEVAYDVKVAPPPDDVWLSFFYSILKKAEPFALRNLSTRGDRVRFTCRGGEVEYAFEALTRLVTETNSVYYGGRHARPSKELAGTEEEKMARDREFVERAKRLL